MRQFNLHKLNQRFFMTAVPGLALCIAMCMAACNEDGENPYVLWQKYTHSEGAFSFYYMAPPFNLFQSEPDHPVLVVDAYDSPSPGELQARIYVEARKCFKSYEAELYERVNEWNLQGYSTVRTFPYTNYFGDVGAMAILERQNNWVKEIFYSYGDSGAECVTISVVTNERGSKEDIEFLLAGFRPGSEDQ